MATVDRLIHDVGGRHSITLLGGLFLVLATGLAFKLASEGSPPFDIFIAFGLSAGPGVILVYRSYQLPNTNIDPQFYPVIGAWCFGSVVVTATALTFYHVQPAAGILTQPTRIILNLASLGGLAGYAIGFHDARARTRATDLEESERRYRTLVDHFPDGAVGLFDEDLRYTAVGGQLLDQVGLTPEDRIGKRVTEVYPDEIVEAYEQYFHAALDGEAHAFEAEFHDRRLYNQTLPVWDANGEVYAGMLVAQDITERKERERELEQYETILESVNEGVYVVDGERNFRWVNEAYSEMLGYAREELIGENASTVVDDEVLQEADEVAAEEGYDNIPRMDVELVTKDGDRVPVEAAATVLPEGEKDGWFRAGVVRDITERVEYERRLEELVADLEESNERLEQFAYVASHDLQEPLRMVSSYLQLLEDRYADDLDEDAQEFIEFAVDGADRMREMIEDLLAYSRVDTEAQPLESTDSEAIVESALRNLERQIEETDADIDVGSLPTVHADRSQLEQVFQNLVSNAIKYCGDDPPEIEISAERDGGGWVFQVADNGIGMDPEQTEQIFEVFERLHADEEYSGTGIGLALCEKIIDRHGGDIWVESEPGEGSIFYFTVPDSTRSHDVGSPSDDQTMTAEEIDG